MTKQETFLSQELRRPVVLNNEALARVAQQLEEHQWEFASADLDRREGRKLANLTMDESELALEKRLS